MRRITNRNATSLVEVVSSTLLVGLLVVGAVSLLGASVRTKSVSSTLVDGPLLAEALLAEIMALPYRDPEDDSAANSTNTGEASVTREDFDDVGDYHNWSTTTVQDRAGNALPDYAGWSRSVTVHWADRTDADTSASDVGLKRIVVTVTAPDGTVTTRFGLRSKAGALEQAPTVDTTVVSLIETSLSIGTPTQTARGVTNLINHVEDPN